MTHDRLNALSKKDLAEKARRLGVPNSITLRKDELIRAILKAGKKLEKTKEKDRAKPTKPVPTSKTSP